MRLFTRHLLSLSLLLTSACSTLVEGTTQKITVNSSPQGAQCLLRQADDIVARVITPGTAIVQKTKNDLVILCSKDGYETVSVNNHSDLAVASLGNAVFYQLSFMGNAVDAATGASNKYDSQVMVRLVPAETPSAFPVPPGMLPAKQLPETIAAGMSMQPPMPGLQAPAPQEPAGVRAASDEHRMAEAAPVTAVGTGPSEQDNPPIHAAVALGKAAQESILALRRQNQVAELTYAQEVEQAPRRPPFEITQ